MPKSTSDCCATGCKRLWPKVRLGDICEINLGKTPPRGVARMWDETRSKGCVWSSIADMANLESGYLIDTKEYVSKAAVEECDIPVVKKGTLLVSFKLTLGRTAIAGRDLYTNEAIAALPFRDSYAGKVDIDYLRTYFAFFDWDEFARKDEKVLGKTLNKKKLAVLPVVLPPLAEQKKIVEKVEKALKRVDALKAQFERMEKSAADYFKAALAETFAAVKGEKVSLENLCELIVDCPHTTAPDEGVGYPLVRTPNIGFGRLVYENMHRVSKAVYDARNARAVPRASDLVFAREAPAGNIAVLQNGEEVCLGQRTVLLRPKMDIVRPDFLAVVVLSPASQKKLLGKSFGATVQHVNVKDIRRFEVIVPALKCQDDVVCRVFAAKAKSERMVAAARRGIEICGKMRKAILAEAFQ